MCFGQYAFYVCRIPTLREIDSYGNHTYLTTTPSWTITSGNTSLKTDGVHLSANQVPKDATSYQLSINITKGIFSGGSLVISCFALLNDANRTKDESEHIVLTPLGELLNVENCNCCCIYVYCSCMYSLL